MKKENISAELSSLLEKFTQVDDGEKIICMADREDLDKFLEIDRERSDLVQLVKKCKRMHQRLQAKETLVWEHVKSKYEQAETADARDKSIGIRRDADGLPVFVEFKPDNDDGPPEVIRRLFGLE